MSRTKIGGWFRGYVEDIAAFSGRRDSPAHRAGFHRYLQHSRCVVDVRVLQVEITDAKIRLRYVNMHVSSL